MRNILVFFFSSMPVPPPKWTGHIPSYQTEHDVSVDAEVTQTRVTSFNG